jgi:hypothetical protein
MLLLLVLCQSKRPLVSATNLRGSGGLHPLAHPKGLRQGQDRIRHFECFNIVRVIERESRANKSRPEISSGLMTHCSRLNDFRQNICAAIVPGRITEALGLLEQKRRPDFVCEMLGYSRWFGNSRFVSEATCIKVIDEVRQLPDVKSGKSPFKRGGRQPFEAVDGGREPNPDELPARRKKRDRPWPPNERDPKGRGGKFADKFPRRRFNGPISEDPEGDPGLVEPNQPIDDGRALRKLRPFTFRKLKNGGSSIDGTAIFAKKKSAGSNIDGTAVFANKKRPAVLEVTHGERRRQSDEESSGDSGKPVRGSVSRKVTVCTGLDKDEKTACLALSRLVSRGMREELKAGMSSQDVCQKLHEQNIIKLGDTKVLSR